MRRPERQSSRNSGLRGSGRWHRNCFLYLAVINILLCTNNRILIKSLYGMLRDEGFGVDIAEHPSTAVQMALEGGYAAVIMDSEPFGLSVEDAIRIIKTILPKIIVIFVGYDQMDTDVLSVEAPIDLEKIKRAVHSIGGMHGVH